MAGRVLSKPFADKKTLLYTTNAFPLRVKRAFVTPVDKSGNDYSPVSVLNNFSKISDLSLTDLQSMRTIFSNFCISSSKNMRLTTCAYNNT